MPEKITTTVKLNSNYTPAAQALQYTTTRASEAIAWLKETQELQKKCDAKQVGSIFASRLRILTDIVSVYISTLAQKGGSGHSLVNSYASCDFVKRFIALPIVQQCQMNRNNRSGHESRNYGGFVSYEKILNSPLEDWLSDIQLFLHSVRENKKFKNKQ